MKIAEIIEKLEERYPLSCAEEWDNVGLLVGRRDTEVTRVLVALDVTEAAIRQAEDFGAELIISHHPLIFRPVHQLTGDSVLGERLLRLSEGGMAVYAMHTNFDIRKMGDLNAEQLRLQNREVLDVTGVDAYDLEEGLGKIGDLEKPMKLGEFALFVKKQMDLDEVRCYGPEGADPTISRVAVCGGSGRSTIPQALYKKAQVLVTGDVDYHTAIDALADGLFLVDAGHFGTEACFVPHVTEECKELFPGLEVRAAKMRPPFQVV